MYQTVNFGDWTFEVNRDLTERTYLGIPSSGADTCLCNDCKNYTTFPDNVFPEQVLNLFNDVGIDYKKEVEITPYKTLSNGLHHFGGWFHFKGRMLEGQEYRVPLVSSGYTLNLTPISGNFSIGFATGSHLTFFDDKTGLVQLEFATNIPWVIDKSLEIS